MKGVFTFMCDSICNYIHQFLFEDAHLKTMQSYIETVQNVEKSDSLLALEFPKTNCMAVKFGIVVIVLSVYFDYNNLK